MAVQIDIRANSEQAKRSIDQLNNSVKNIETSTQNVNNSFKNLGRIANFAAAAIAAAFTGNAITRAADTYKEINSSLRLATRNAKELASAQRSINKITIETRGNLSGTANLFARLNRSAIQLGRSQQETVKATRAISQAIQISGASAASAQAAIIQLGQGLASGTLRGEELNSVLEQTPRVAQAIAKELGVSLGQLRKIASEGKVTSEVVFDALVKQSAQINREFASVSLTVGQAFNVLNTGATTFLAAIDKSLGLSTALANRIQLVGKFLNDFGTEFEDRLTILKVRLSLFAIDVESIFTNLFSKVQGLFDNLTFSNIGFEIESDAFNKAKAKFNEIGEELKRVSNFEIGIDFSGIKNSVDTVKTFVSNIYNYFYDLYVDLVGNSVVPDMVSDIIYHFQYLRSEGIKTIIAFVSDIEGSFDRIVNHQLTQKGLAPLKESIDKLKQTETFSKLESALDLAKQKAIEVGTVLKDAFQATFSLDAETKIALEGGLGAVLIAAISGQGVINAFKFAIENAGKLVKPIAILTVTESFGTQIAKQIETVDFSGLGKKLGAGFNDVANNATSSGTGNLITQLGAEALALIRGAFEGAFVDPNIKDGFSNLIVAGFVAALVSSSVRTGIASAFGFALTGGALSDQAGFGKNATKLNDDIATDRARKATQRLGGGIGAALAGLFVSGVIDELGGSAGEQIAGAFAAALVGGIAATALTNAALSFAGTIGSGLLIGAGKAGLTAAGALLGGAVLTTLALLAGPVLFPEETQALVRAVFGDSAGDFVIKVNKSLNNFGDRIAKLFDSILRSLGLRTDAPEVSQNEAEIRDATIEQLRILKGTIGLSKNQNILLSRLIKDTQDTKNTNIEVANKIESLLSRFRDMQGLDVNETLISTQLKELADILRGAITLQDIEARNAPRSLRSPPSIPIGEDFRARQLVGLESLLGAINTDQNPNSAQSITTAITAIQDSSKTLLDVSNDLQNLAESTRLLSEVKTSLQSLSAVFKAEAKRLFDLQTQRSRAEMLQQGIPETFANGGRVFGSGTSRSDSIPAYLSNGEFVVNAKATSRNLGLLSAINGGRNPGGAGGRFSNGGQITFPYSNKKFTDNELKVINSLGDFGVKTKSGLAVGLGSVQKEIGPEITELRERLGKFDGSSLFKNVYPKMLAYYFKNGRFKKNGKANTDDVPYQSFFREMEEKHASDTDVSLRYKNANLKTALNTVNMLTAAGTQYLKAGAGNTSIDDGWKYRGRGWLQYTGRDIYDDIGYLDNPDLLGTSQSENAKALVTYFTNKSITAGQINSNSDISSLSTLYNDVINPGRSSDATTIKKFANTALPKFTNNKTKVKKGEGGVAVARREGISFARLKEVNPGIDMAKLEIGQILNLASGGRVRGPGTGRSDSIPAMLSNGEFVVNAKSTARNRGLLESINRQKFNVGGMAGSAAQFDGSATGSTVDILRKLLNVTVKEDKFEELNDSAKTTIELALDTLQNVNSRIAEAAKQNDMLLMAKLFENQKITEKVLRDKLGTIIENQEDGKGIQGPSFGERVMSGVDTGEAGRAAGKSFINAIKRAVIEGEGDTKSILKSFIDGFTGTIVNQFFDSLAKEFSDEMFKAFKENGGFSDIFSGLSNSFGGVFSLLGGGQKTAHPLTFNDMNFDLASGGMVPGPLGAPVPGIAHGGEMILNPTQQAAVFGNKSANGASIVNLEVQIVGDVSDATRREVQKMTPQLINQTQSVLAERRLLATGA